MRRLLRLYPRAWRRRYGREMEALLHQMRPGPREVLDLLTGALDARLNPQWPGSRRRHVRRVPGARFLAAWGILLALRAAGDWLLVPAALTLAHDARVVVPNVVGGAVVAAAWTGLAAVLLRRARLRWTAAIAAACLLELVLGASPYSLSGLVGRWRLVWPALPLGDVHLIGVALWAAAVAGLLGRRWGRPWADPPEGAPVGARPAPEPPQPVEAISRRAS